MNFTDDYKLSVYAETALIKETDYSTVKLVRSALDGKQYIKKEYVDNKSHVFSVLQKINCRNLPAIKEIIGGRIVIEEYIEGVTLEKVLSGGMPEKKQCEKIFGGILNALNELHKNKIIHRDVKLSNIIIKPDGTPVLVDFGISKLYNPTLEKDTSYFGTEGYAPPEQFGFALTDYRSDVYSFGVTAEKLGLKKYSRIIAKCKSLDPSNRYADAHGIINAVKLSRISPVIIAAFAVIAAVIIAFVFKAVIKTDNNEERETDYATVKPTEIIYETQTHVTAPETVPQESVTFSTSRRLQLFDHPEPYRVIATDEHIYSILIMETQADEKIIAPLGNGAEAEVHYVLNENNLKLTFNDGRRIFNAEFSLEPIPEGEQKSELVMAEIVFYDIDGDGVFEIIPMFCHCRFSLSDDSLNKYVNSWEGYCIDYNTETGFELCEGSIRVLGSESRNVFFSGGEITSDNGRNRYVIVDGAFKKQK